MLVTSAALSTSDNDTAATQLMYNVTSSLQGYVQVNGQNASSFTQADLDSNQVTFVHDGSEGAQAGFNFTVTDGTTTIPAQPFSITVTPVGDAPALVVSTGATVNEVCTACSWGCCWARVPESGGLPTCVMFPDLGLPPCRAPSW